MVEYGTAHFTEVFEQCPLQNVYHGIHFEI